MSSVTARRRTVTRPTASVLYSLLLTLSIVAVTAATASPASAAPTESESQSAATFTGNASSANARFVVAGYRELLGRTADTSGLDFHVSRLTAGGDQTRQAFTYSMLFSVEGSRQEVRRAYQVLLDRPVDAEGEAYWTSHLQGHGVLDLRVLLMSSDEYYGHSGGTDHTWLEALYLDILGRHSDDEGRLYWQAVIGSGVPRQLVAAGIYLSEEALGNRVDTYYQESIGRAPSAAERAGAIGIIGRIGERGLRAQILASDEVFETYLQAALS